MITGVTNVSSLRSAEYILENAKIVVVVSPSELMKFPSAAQLLPLFGKSKFPKLIGFPIVELQDVELISIDPLGKFNRVGGGADPVVAGLGDSWSSTPVALVRFLAGRLETNALERLSGAEIGESQ